MFAPLVNTSTRLAANLPGRAPQQRSTLGVRTAETLADRHSANDPSAGNHGSLALAGSQPEVSPRDFSQIPRFPVERSPERSGSPGVLGTLQRKLTVGRTDDPLEHEADRVAEKVMGMPAPGVRLSSAPPQISRVCAECEEEERVQKQLTRTIESPASEALATVHEVLRSPGQPLNASMREYFEPRFGRDFSQVRIHHDSAAATSAQALAAQAFTSGAHVVFAEGRHRPGTAEGRKLLAHELTHVVQQTRHGPVLQLKDDPDLDTQTSAPDPATDLFGALLHAIETPLYRMILTPSKSSPSSTPAVLILKQRWPAIHAWIINAGVKGKRVRAPAEFPDLAAPTLVDALNERSAYDRVKLADAIFDRWVSNLGSATPDLYRKEFAMLSKTAKELIEPDEDRLVGYIAMREGLKATFGSIKALNAFYDNLVEADFPPGSGVFGKHTLVHRDLKQSLDRAAALLAKKKLTEAVVNHLKGAQMIAGQTHLRGFWGTSIRENRNRPASIGNHSFGFAIDINGDWNPNLPNFPWEHVQRLTGFDVYGEDLKKANPSQNFDTVLAAAKKAKSASDQFRDIFESEDNLKKAMVAEATKAGAPLVSANDLFKAVVTASEDKAHASTASAGGFAAVASLLNRAMSDEEERKARAASADTYDPTMKSSSAAHVEPVAVAIIISGLSSKMKSRADLPVLMPVVRAQLNDPKDDPTAEAKKLGLTFLFRKNFVAELRKLSPSVRSLEMPDSILFQMQDLTRSADATALAKYLIELHRIFVSTRIESGSHAGEKIGTGATGNLQTVAAHGFMDLMPELVAALTSNEGGGLQWLGTVGRLKSGARGSKDWMHFELLNPPKIARDAKWETDSDMQQMPPAGPLEPASEQPA
jgi:hypothetical protein